MTRTEISWEREKISFKGYKWEPEGPAEAVICLVHGHGEHCGRYAHVAQWFTSKGFALIAFDLRGHGNSGGKRGHTPSYEHLMDDITEFLNQAELAFPTVRKFLYGHSMGGNIVANYIIRKKPPVQGGILTGAWFKLAFKPPALKVMLGRLMNGIFPGLTQKSNLNTLLLSRDRDVVTAYENDPLVHNKISARLGITMMDAGIFAIENANTITLPLLVMHGTGDQITSPDASKEFHNNAGNASPQLNLFRGLYHEIHNEPEKEEVFKTIESWMRLKLS
jgi:acylglycerol lipase